MAHKEPASLPAKEARRARRSRLSDRISIKGRIFTGFALFAAILLAVLWLSQVVFLEEIYKLTKIAEIYSAANELGDKMDSEDLASDCQAIGEKKGVCISVLLIGPDGKVQPLANADCVKRCLIHNPAIDPSSFYELYKFIEAEGGSKLQHYRYDFKEQTYYATSGTLFDRSRDEASIVYTRLMKDHLDNQLMVMFNTVISPLDATVQTLRTQLTIITVLVILLAAILAALLSHRISRPLSVLNEKAKLLAKSDYTVDFTATGYREICELGQTLNYTESELSKVDKLKSELIANISHDLRTPLTLISGYAEVMRDIPGEITPENLQIIIDEAGRLTSFVNQILDMSRLRSGSIEMNPTTFSMTDFLMDSLSRYNKLLEGRDYRILLDAPDPVTVCADRVRFEQAFYNLLNNAITHAGEYKTVTVSQRLIYDENAIPRAVRIHVIDSGEGIPPESLPYIWDRYYKVDKVHKRAHLGSGLGLSIVKTIMECMNGRYGVESTLGVGSCFWIELPL